MWNVLFSVVFFPFLLFLPLVESKVSFFGAAEEVFLSFSKKSFLFVRFSASFCRLVSSFRRFHLFSSLTFLPQ